MGVQAEALTARFVQAQAELADAVRRCPAAQWQAKNADGEWTVAYTAQHVALSTPGILGVVLGLAAGAGFPTSSLAEIDAENKASASAHDNADKDEVLPALKSGGELVARQLPALSDAQLAATIQIPQLENMTVSLSQFVEMALIGHVSQHLAAMLVPA